MRRLRSRWSLLSLFVVLVGGMAAPAEGQAPRRIVLFIGDGVGASYWTALALAADDLAVKQFKVMGLVDTRASDSKVTDSAAGATAFASGVRTYNGAIGVGPDSMEVKTVLEAAQERGMATGLVATSRITHATPAAFAAHVPSRLMEGVIAEHIAARNVDVVLGGGRAVFDATRRSDSLDLLTPIKSRYVYVETPEELSALDADTVRNLFGLFTLSHMPAAASRYPTLPEMTRTALAVLDHDPEGFFLMVEASQPDWRGHGNESLEAVVAEMRDFDLAIGEALDYQSRNPETLVIVVADHETGGLAIEEARDSVVLADAAAELADAANSVGTIGSVMESSTSALADTARYFMSRLADQLRLGANRSAQSVSVVARYTTLGHTAQMIPLFASGPGAEQFGGMVDNTRVGQLLLEAVRR